jgi:hypothetical protein
MDGPSSNSTGSLIDRERRRSPPLSARPISNKRLMPPSNFLMVGEHTKPWPRHELNARQVECLRFAYHDSLCGHNSQLQPAKEPLARSCCEALLSGGRTHVLRVIDCRQASILFQMIKTVDGHPFKDLRLSIRPLHLHSVDSCHLSQPKVQPQVTL